MTIWQNGSHWVRLETANILAVKVSSVSEVIIRERDGKRHVLNLFRLSSGMFESVLAELTRGLVRVHSVAGRVTYERAGEE